MAAAHAGGFYLGDPPREVDLCSDVGWKDGTGKRQCREPNEEPAADPHNHIIFHARVTLALIDDWAIFQPVANGPLFET